MKTDSIESIFASETAEHVMIIRHDDGVYRHLDCGKPGTGICRFSLVTWPGYLAITGDCGDYVFTRLPDMFEFFRGHRVNPGYWAEKCVAVDRNSPVKEWSEEKFAAVIREYLDKWVKRMDPEDARDLREEIEAGLQENESDEHYALQWANDFDHNGYTFIDIWDNDFKDYGHHFLWCLHAIVWGIGKYDAMKKEVSP